MIQNFSGLISIGTKIGDEGERLTFFMLSKTNSEQKKGVGLSPAPLL